MWNRTRHCLQKLVPEITPAEVAKLDPNVPVKGFGTSSIYDVAYWLEENGVDNEIVREWLKAGWHHYGKVQNRWKAEKRKRQSRQS